MRLHRYQAADRRPLRLIVNRYPGEFVGPSGDLTAVLDDLEDARRRLAPIAFPHQSDGSPAEGTDG